MLMWVDAVTEVADKFMPGMPWWMEWIGWGKAGQIREG
jgi:hypothetical protein